MPITRRLDPTTPQQAGRGLGPAAAAQGVGHDHQSGVASGGSAQQQGLCWGELGEMSIAASVIRAGHRRWRAGRRGPIPPVRGHERGPSGWRLGRGRSGRRPVAAGACQLGLNGGGAGQVVVEGGLLGVHPGIRDVIDDATMNALFDQEAKLFTPAQIG